MVVVLVIDGVGRLAAGGERGVDMVIFVPDMGRREHEIGTQHAENLLGFSGIVEIGCAEPHEQVAASLAQTLVDCAIEVVAPVQIRGSGDGWMVMRHEIFPFVLSSERLSGENEGGIDQS